MDKTIAELEEEYSRQRRERGKTERSKPERNRPERKLRKMEIDVLEGSLEAIVREIFLRGTETRSSEVFPDLFFTNSIIDHKKIGATAKEIRERYGVYASYVGKSIGCSRSQMSHLEAGAGKKWSPKLLLKYLEAVRKLTLGRNSKNGKPKNEKATEA